MLSNFFSFGNRNYINNAIVLADSLDKITSIYGNVLNFRLQFKKPFLSQAEFSITPYKAEGHYVGQFEVDGVPLYFSYNPVDIPLEIRTLTVDDIDGKIDIINTCYYIAENCHQRGWEAFEKIYGCRNLTDKSIVVIYEIPDTSVIMDVIEEQKKPDLKIFEPELIGDRRFKLAVMLDERLLGFRYSSIKAFVI